jgi:ribosome-associated translation inhibitor RaiA
MRLELTGRHVRITPGIRTLVDERLQKLDRLLHDRAVSLQVVLYLEK